ncbi:LLM class flavin-dependent oxidoreductase [Paraglaciecola sp. L3A3]|uniref:LLM class flavin-dependent oxidoreductase n=1 Tax=Paraglaciecola sp. L3A3 TaxID=2686358 RepID=UPI00131C8E4A|nr:LLM class flavin-dependent oxidoreductase [Paraglaciecola sp. L3A3]
MIPLSLLDLAPVCQGSTITTALNNSREMAVAAEQLGYSRIWLAEHHGMLGVASSATALAISHIAAATKHIRIGAGGIMLPNHSPLIIAEQFGTLEALYPGRIDLGLGRAPGTDMATARALRRNLQGSVDQYPQDIEELQQLLGPQQPEQTIIAVPGNNSNIPIWLLGSSLYSAQLAASKGLPYSFASHFAPDQLFDALNLYRQGFKPSAQQASPYVSAGMMAVVADTDEQANYLFSSLQQQFVNLRRGNNQTFQPPTDNMQSRWTEIEEMMVKQTLRYALVGSQNTVKQKLEKFIDATQVDEVIVSMPIYDLEDRLHSLALLADLKV